LRAGEPAMKRIITTPRDNEHWLELRKENLNSTEVPALYGISPYKTHFEMWHMKKGNLVDLFKETNRTRNGQRFQQVIAEAIVEQYYPGGELIPFDEYVTIEGLRLGSSFDYVVFHNGTKRILEIKKVDRLEYKRKWTNEEGPPHIEMQLQHQMGVANIADGTIGVMVGDDFKIVERKLQEPIFADILDKAAKFWKSIDDNTPPDETWPDDASIVAKLYSFAEADKVITSTEDIDNAVAAYKLYSEQIAALEGMRAVEKAKILKAIGDAEKVIGNTYKISAGLIGPVEVKAHTKKQYRNFKIFHSALKETDNER
jgi:putative phage-type endonuclease